VGEEERVVEGVGQVERRPGCETERVERELGAALRRDERVTLDSLVHDRVDVGGACHAAHRESIGSARPSRGTSEEGGAPVPLIRVELFDYRVNEETSAKLIAGLTDALCAATHEGLRDHTWVIVEGHDPKNWGLGGKPWPVGEMPPGPA
jgi:phenylpyruvate tautomerase PptA (4-oxalocrotonate tautomerase family)